MIPRKSRILRALRTGESACCIKMNLSDPRVVEICGISGIPGIWLCNEHVPNDWLNLENQIRAADKHNMDSIVRVSRGSYSEYIKPFEAGATGIMVPHVETADDARQVVEWTRFHPLGKRGLDGGNVDGLFCHLPLKDYIEHDNNERFIILQIESPEGLSNVEEIAAVEGYDFLLFGAGDFSHRINRLEAIDDPQVVEARKRVGEAAQRNGKFGMLPGIHDSLQTHLEEGYQLFGVGSDVIALSNYFHEKKKFFEEAQAEGEASSNASIR